MKGLGAIESTQFYRGEIFTTLDHLMGKSYEGTDSELFEVAVQFIKKIIELVTAYFKLVPDMVATFNEIKQEYDLYLVDENAAIASCYPEFIDMLKNVFCLNARLLRFYLKHDRPPAELKTSICKPIAGKDFEISKIKNEDLDFEDVRELVGKKKDLDFGLFYEFLDHFHLHGGFEAVRKALKCVVPADGELTLPLDLVPIITSPFRNCGAVINQSYAKDMADEVQAVILGRLESMTDDEMKEIEKTTLNNLLSELREFLCIALDETAIDEKLETVKLSMALRFLRSPNMK